MPKGGHPYYSRILSADVRDLTLREIRRVLLDKRCKSHTKEFRQQLILRLAGSVLPRIQENSGPGGGPMEMNAQVVILPPRNEKNPLETK